MGGNETVVGGTIPQRLLSCLQSLDDLLHQNIPVVSSFVHAEKVQTERRKTTDTLMQTICKIMGKIYIKQFDIFAKIVGAFKSTNQMLNKFNCGRGHPKLPDITFICDGKQVSLL